MQSMMGMFTGANAGPGAGKPPGWRRWVHHLAAPGEPRPAVWAPAVRVSVA